MKWEYKVWTRPEPPKKDIEILIKVSPDLNDADDVFNFALNGIGLEGWELVAASGDRLFFKRPIE